MVLRLCNRIVGGRRGHRPEIWETLDATGRLIGGKAFGQSSWILSKFGSKQFTRWSHRAMTPVSLDHRKSGGQHPDDPVGALGEVILNCKHDHPLPP